ncbi:MAG TPA: enolase C-terminal domain-like protein [Casimicrobiaceae bacterium]|nr:enolase C-terminal domain-like protein [Casimicrobiaceae bacterium]
MRALDRVVVHRLRVPLTVPYKLAFGPVEHFDTIIAEAIDSDGRSGFGEATILTGYTEETIDDAWRVAQELAAELAAAAEGAEQRIAARGVGFPFTATAFGTALEMLSRSPLLDLASDAAVPLVGLLNAKDEPAMEAEVPKLLAAGYRTIKVKVGFEVGEDIALVAAAQKVVRGRAALRLDANQAYTADEGVRFVKALDPEGIELFEQPCAAADWDAHLAVVRAAGVPMMLDESIYGLADIDRAARLGAATYLKLKLMKLVTLSALSKAIDRIRELGMKPVLGNGVACDPGCWMEGCIAARQIDNAGEMNGFLKARSPLIENGLSFRDGAMQLGRSYAPRLDHGALAAYSVHSRSFTSARRT